MACVLRVDGPSFDPDEFLKECRLSPSRVWRRGEPRLARGQREPNGGLNIAVSNAAMSDLRQQVTDAVAFMRENRGELARLISFAGVQRAGLDFAVSWRDDVTTHSDYFPPELIRLAGELGLALEVSHYPVSDADAR